MSERKKQIETEAMKFGHSMRDFHDSDGVDASQCWSLGAQWADANPDTTKQDARREKVESILLPEKRKMAKSPMSGASEATLKKYADMEDGHDISAGGPPASSTPSEQDERDFQAYRKSPEYRIGEIPAFLAGMVPAEILKLHAKSAKEFRETAVAEAEKAATMRERERCANIACGYRKFTPQETTAFNNMPKELPNEEAK